MKNKILYMFLTVVVAVFVWSCAKDKWNDHYNDTAGRGNALQTIMKGLRSNGYNAFADAMEKVKLDKAINSGVQYTIFAVPDAAFNAATSQRTGLSPLSDDSLKYLLLNHIMGGKRFAASFTDTVYRATEGEKLYIWMNKGKIANFQFDSVKITKKDIDIIDATIFEVSGCIKQYPDIVNVLKANFSTFYSYYAKDFSNTKDTINIGFQPNGLTYDTLKTKIFAKTGNVAENIALFMPSNDYFGYYRSATNYKGKFGSIMSSGNANWPGVDSLSMLAVIGPYDKKPVTSTFGIDTTLTGFYKYTSVDGNAMQVKKTLVEQIVKLKDGNRIYVTDTIFYTPANPLNTFSKKFYEDIFLGVPSTQMATGFTFPNYVKGIDEGNHWPPNSPDSWVWLNTTSIPALGSTLDMSLVGVWFKNATYKIDILHTAKSNDRYTKWDVYLDGIKIGFIDFYNPSTSGVIQATQQNGQNPTLISSYTTAINYKTTHILRFKCAASTIASIGETMGLYNITFTKQ